MASYCIAGSMDEKTVRALNAINRSFYGTSDGGRASAFSATRRTPWPGWTRLPPLLRALPSDAALAVLDVGCGNGRFGAYLADALPAARNRLHYHGLDASEPLLATLRARALPFATVETICSDVIETPIAEALGSRSFAFVAVFGMLHHVPAEANRKALLRALAARLTRGGLLAFAVWRFEDFERFRARERPWAEHNAVAEEAISEDQLEAGDRLLPWGEDGRAVRYCHFADDAEVERWLADSPLDVVARYDADGREGRLNRYFVLQVKGAP